MNFAREDLAAKYSYYAREDCAAKDYTREDCKRRLCKRRLHKRLRRERLRKKDCVTENYAREANSGVEER